MKKILMSILVGLVVLVVLIVVTISFFLDGAIRHAVVTYGPRFTKVNIGLDSVNLSLLSGSGTLKGLTVGNPEGFKTPEAMKVGRMSLSLVPSSLLSDKVVVRSLQLESPEVTYETDFKNSNLKQIQANLDQNAGRDKAPPPAPTHTSEVKEEKAANRKLEVDDLVITGVKVHLSLTALGGKSATLSVPDIHLTNLGQGPDGITTAELAKVIWHEISAQTEKAAAGSITGLGKDLGGFGQSATNAAQKLGKSLGGLFH